MVTSVYAALLVIVFVALSVRTLLMRRRKRIAVGDSGDVQMLRVIRAHGNFAEYVPMALLLLFLLESRIDSTLWIHLLGIGLIIGRISHAVGVSRMPEQFGFRVFGMAMTFTVMLSSAAIILLDALVSV